MDISHIVETIVTITFEERAGKTVLTILREGFERREDRDGIESGRPSIVGSLERVVASTVAARNGGMP